MEITITNKEFKEACEKTVECVDTMNRLMEIFQIDKWAGVLGPYMEYSMKMVEKTLKDELCELSSKPSEPTDEEIYQKHYEKTERELRIESIKEKAEKEARENFEKRPVRPITEELQENNTIDAGYPYYKKSLAEIYTETYNSLTRRIDADAIAKKARYEAGKAAGLSEEECVELAKKSY